MQKFQKIRGFFGKKTVFKPWTKFNLYFKTVQLIIYAVGMDMAFAMVGYRENLVRMAAMSPLEAYDLFFYYCVLIGVFFMSAGFWRLMEIYWYFKDAHELDVKEGLYSVTSE